MSSFTSCSTTYCGWSRVGAQEVLPEVVRAWFALHSGCSHGTDFTRCGYVLDSWQFVTGESRGPLQAVFNQVRAKRYVFCASMSEHGEVVMTNVRPPHEYIRWAIADRLNHARILPEFEPSSNCVGGRFSNNNGDGSSFGGRSASLIQRWTIRWSINSIGTFSILSLASWPIYIIWGRRHFFSTINCL